VSPATNILRLKLLLKHVTEEYRREDNEDDVSSYCMTLSKIKDVVFFLLGDSPASEFYMLTFRNFVSSIFIGGVSRKGPPMKM
jgi:hypothetical protein